MRMTAGNNPRGRARTVLPGAILALLLAGRLEAHDTWILPDRLARASARLDESVTDLDREGFATLTLFVGPR